MGVGEETGDIDAVAAMMAGDEASRSLGMQVLSYGAGRAEVRMTVRPDMVNGYDIAHGGLIPLRAIIEGNGPPIGAHVNTYYLQFWSLTHFLLHHDGGRHAPAYRRLLARGGTLADFEAAFGPIERVQAQWYVHLQAQLAAATTSGP